VAEDRKRENMSDKNKQEAVPETDWNIDQEDAG
jgi:hypothetical protein